MQTTARSLILDLLSTLRRGTMPVRALVEAGELLGIAENNIRVSLARLYASGRVERDERGRYRLGPAVAAMSGQLRSWRRLTERACPWNGAWIAVHQTKLGRGPARRRRDRALALLGFRDLEAGLAVRPDNLTGGVAFARTRLAELTSTDDESARSGADGTANDGVGRVFQISQLDATSELAARSLWDADRLATEAKASTERLRESAQQIHRLTTGEAMVETFMLGGGVLRQLVRHPLLPEEILDPKPLDALLQEMKRYDELGRACWAEFLAGHSVPHRALPLDARQPNPEFSALAPNQGRIHV